MYKTSRHLAKQLTQERTTLKNRARMYKIISAPSHPNEYKHDQSISHVITYRTFIK